MRERMMSRILALGVLTLGSTVLANPLEGTVDTPSLTGSLRTPAGLEVASREGWAPEEILDLGEGRALVLWRSLPRRNYLALEVWAPGAEGYRRTWPAEDGVAWFQGEARLRPHGTAREVLLSHALVTENFEAPLLRRHRVYRVTGDRLVLAGERVAKPLTDSQRVNLAALRAAEGDGAEARRVAAGIQARDPRARAAVARSRVPGASHDTALREELRGLAGRADPAGKAAAGALLRLALEGAPSESSSESESESEPEEGTDR